jgi:hypothetical protein
VAVEVAWFGTRGEASGAGPTCLPVHLVTEVEVLDVVEGPIPLLQILVVVAVATGLACLPAAIAIAALLGVGIPAPTAFGLTLVGGLWVFCLKVVAIIFGIVSFTGDDSSGDVENHQER